MAGYKREKKPGVWELTVTTGADYTGKRRRHYKTIYAKTEREAEKELSRFFIQCEEGDINPASLTTVGQLYDYYFKEYAKRFLKKSTQESTRAAAENWILPLLGNKKLSRLKKVEVQQWINNLADQDKSPKTIRNYYSVLRSMLDYAKDMELIVHNPAEGCKLPKLNKKESRSYNVEQLAKILDGLEEIPGDKLAYKCGILLSIFGGFRKGEVLGFNWEDVNFDDNTITVRRTRMSNPNAGLYEDSPKTDKSLRTVALPKFVIDELKDLRIRQLEDRLKYGIYYSENNALLKQPGGEPITPPMFDKFFRNLCPDVGVPCYGLHSLRHTHASLLASIGADEVEVSKRLGHSNLTTTLNIYTHLFEHRDNALAENLDKFRTQIAK